MHGPWSRASDSAEAIARDLVAEVGRWPAISYMLGRVVGAGTWPRARQAGAILKALICGAGA